MYLPGIFFIVGGTVSRITQQESTLNTSSMKNKIKFVAMLNTIKS